MRICIVSPSKNFRSSHTQSGDIANEKAQTKFQASDLTHICIKATHELGQVVLFRYLQVPSGASRVNFSPYFFVFET